MPPDGRATIARVSMVPAAIPAASASARVAADARVAAMRPAAAGALSQRRSFVGARGIGGRRRRATRASTPVVRASWGGSISPDLNHTEEAFTVPLDRVAPGAFVSVSVRADATPEAAIDALVAVVRVHAPGEVQLQWGLGSENPDGSISRDPWECPPEALMPPGSYVVDSWATGSAVRTPLDSAGEVHIPLPSRPGHGLAFVLFDADKGCYYDDGTDRAFFLDSNASALAAGRATAAAIEAARAQADRVRDIARAEANAAAARETEAARLRALADVEREAEDEEREARRRKAVEEQSAYERMMADASNPMAKGFAAPATKPAPPPGFTPPGAPASTPYERYMNDPSNPFMNYTHAAPAATAVAAPPPPPAPAPAAPRADDFTPAFTAGGGGGGGGGWASASSSAATASYTPPTPPPAPAAPAPPAPAAVGSAAGAVVARHTISLTTESGSSTGTCEVEVMATWPPTVRLSCQAGGAAAGQPLLLHWGVSDRRGGSWHSPYDELQSVPPGSRAPDAQSCESALEGGSRVVEFAPERAGVTCMTMLIRTENCQEWLRDTDGGDVFIDVSPALDAVRSAGQGASPPAPTQAAPPPGVGASTGTHWESLNGHQQQQQQQQHQHQHHHHHHEPAPAPPPPPPPPPPPQDTGDHMALMSNWRGADVELKDHKGGNRDRRNQWNTDGLPDAARRIVENDRDSASWRQKLQKMEEVLCWGDAGYADMDALGYAAVYLFWVGVGAVACVEDGSHYRPNHHAGSSQRIYESIEAVEKHASGQGGRHAEEVRALIRRLHPRLPAFTAEFTQSVPLTRIRDIAHGKGDRDGKCREVRAEIKHTIQNKLHRCAGPEDLVATEKMLAKLTAPGTDYPEEFVEEFRIFHRELKDFFNASTVTDRLDKLLQEGNVPGSVAEVVSAFAHAKAKVDAIQGSQSDPVLLAALEEALDALSRARRVVDDELVHGGLASAAPDQRQQWRLAEIGLEDYAFVLLSRGINALGAESDPPRNELDGNEMRAALKFLAAASDATALSSGGGAGEEFGHIAREAGELATAGPGGVPPGGEDGALRVRAVAERARRAAEDHCQLLSDLFDGRASALGNALGIDRHTVDVFTEGQIRASVVFQSAKLASHLLRAARAATGEAGWDCLVAGEVRGARLVSVPRLDPADPTIRSLTAENPAVLLVQAADGDEEVSTCGPGVAGILLCHALPHLSHLALRARQAAVPLVAIEDPGLVNHAKSLESAPGVHFVAQPSNISLNASEGGFVASGGGGGAAAPRVAAAALSADLSAAGAVIDLRDLGAAEWSRGVAIAGSKATACAVLSALATDPQAGFQAPPGAVLPFGSMQEAARAVGADQRLNFLVDALESVQTDQNEIGAVCGELQELVRQLRPSQEAMRALTDTFSATRGAKVMVRSTGNAEDLAGLSAAGLYDSISNVDPEDHRVLGAAVAEVWASLYTTRAVASRAAAGVGQRDAHMAVLVQQMLVPEVSFILMTKHPMTNDPNVAYAELALGHGETLASGAVRGTPWRMSMNRLVPGEAQLNAISSFGAALVPDLAGDGTLKSQPVNCASHWLSTDDRARSALADRLVRAGGFIEARLGVVDGAAQALPQDIEGCLTEDGQVWVVQARPQP